MSEDRLSQVNDHGSDGHGNPRSISTSTDPCVEKSDSLGWDNGASYALGAVEPDNRKKRDYQRGIDFSGQREETHAVAHKAQKADVLDGGTVVVVMKPIGYEEDSRQRASVALSRRNAC